jgi:hypothetical protein
VCKQSSVVRHYDIGSKKTSENYPNCSYKTWHSVSVTVRDEALITVRHGNKIVPLAGIEPVAYRTHASSMPVTAFCSFLSSHL